MGFHVVGKTRAIFAGLLEDNAGRGPPLAGIDRSLVWL